MQDTTSTYRNHMRIILWVIHNITKNQITQDLVIAQKTMQNICINQVTHFIQVAHMYSHWRWGVIAEMPYSLLFQSINDTLRNPLKLTLFEKKFRKTIVI